MTQCIHNVLKLFTALLVAADNESLREIGQHGKVKMIDGLSALICRSLGARKIEIAQVHYSRALHYVEFWERVAELKIKLMIWSDLLQVIALISFFIFERLNVYSERARALCHNCSFKVDNSRIMLCLKRGCQANATSRKDRLEMILF